MSIEEFKDLFILEIFASHVHCVSSQYAAEKELTSV